MRPIICMLAGLFLGLQGAYGDPEVPTEEIPAAYASEKAVCLMVESKVADVGHMIKVRLVNPTRTPIVFRGYSEAMPWYRIQSLVDGAWEEFSVGWFCGTGLRECVIPAGESSVISVDVRKDVFPVRIGVQYAHGKTLSGIFKKEARVVWSAQIDKSPAPPQ